MTHWHITFGTYGARLHGCDRPTVTRKRNQPNETFVPKSEALELHSRQLMTDRVVFLTLLQRNFVEQSMAEIAVRGGWKLDAVAAAPDHVHVLLEAPSEPHGRNIRQWLKRWLAEALNQEFKRRAKWFAVGGSTKAIHDQAYLDRARHYVLQQRSLR